MKQLSCSWGSVNYALWNENSPGIPIIALHGWLDNCCSFKPLAQFIDLPLTAPDFPGHGLSSHLQNGSWYHFVDYVIRTHEIIEKLKFNRFYLIGHSLGAAVAALYSSMFPEKVSKLILIDGLGPLTDRDENAKDNLHKAIISRRKKEHKKERSYSDLETAVKARCGAGKISRTSAEILVRHHLKEVESGYRWTYDSKLKYTSPLRMTPGQLESFLSKIQTKTLLLAAKEGLIINGPYWPLRKLINNLQVIEVKGHHHFHMDSAAVTAAHINKFLLKD